MAERLKEQLLEKEKIVDLVAGPDAYRDLPQLLSQVHTLILSGGEPTISTDVVYIQVESGQQAMNVMLSLDETYADITPVRMSENGVSAYVYVVKGLYSTLTN